LGTSGLKAQVLHKPAPIEERPLVSEVVPDPVPGPREVLVRIRACGVCRSNLHLIEGDFLGIGIPSKLPIIPGHELSGVVEEVGSDVKMRNVGQRIGVQNLLRSCGHCKYCLNGREQLCPNAVLTGETADGGFAEFIVAPEDFTYPLPDNLGFEEAAPLFCPGITAYSAVKRAGIRMGQRVAVIGIGGVGHLSLQFAKLAGAEVTAVDVSRNKLDLALDLGAKNAVLASEFGKQRKFDVVMVHTPSQQAVDQAAKSVVPGGTIMLAVFGRVDVDFTQEYTIMTCNLGSRSDTLDLVELASKREFKVRWEARKLSEANDVLLRLKRGEILARAVLVT
jgi:propanol-preferring alcohol dehydrogenase